MFATVGRVVESYISRGDPAVEAADFTQATLTTDGTWRDLDLSAIVPAGVKLVELFVNCTDDVIGRVLKFRKKGSVSEYAISLIRTQVINLTNDANMQVECNTLRQIQYNATNAVWTAIGIFVLGYWK